MNVEVVNRGMNMLNVYARVLRLNKLKNLCVGSAT